jgi:hypothetical protein
LKVDNFIDGQVIPDKAVGQDNLEVQVRGKKDRANSLGATLGATGRTHI